MTKDKILDILKRVIGTIALPIVMFLLFLIICRAKGNTTFGNADTFQYIGKYSCIAVLIAAGLSTQILNGRFDFSGGATIILSGIIAGNLALMWGESPWLMLVLCIVISVAISMLTATMYKLFKLPIVICSIALTLVYESLTLLLFDAKGINIVAKTNMTIFGRDTNGGLIYLITFAGIAIYHYFKEISVAGTRARLLSNNQTVSTNIGIDEGKNLYATYLISGLLYGLAAVVYVSQNWVQYQEDLATTSVAFSYIVPVYIGMFIGLLSYGWVGIVVGAVTITTLKYGLMSLMGDSGGWYNIFFGLFMMAFWVFSAELDNIKKLLNKIKNAFTSTRTKKA